MQDGLVEPLDDTVCLRAFGLGAGMIDVLHRQIELIFVTLGVSAILGATVCKCHIKSKLLHL